MRNKLLTIIVILIVLASIRLRDSNELTAIQAACNASTTMTVNYNNTTYLCL